MDVQEAMAYFFDDCEFKSLAYPLSWYFDQHPAGTVMAPFSVKYKRGAARSLAALALLDSAISQRLETEIVGEAGLLKMFKSFEYIHGNYAPNASIEEAALVTAAASAPSEVKCSFCSGFV